MDTPAGPVNRKLALDRGGQERRVYGAKRALDREQHTLVVAATADVSTAIRAEHRDWAYDLRRGRLRIYGGLLRFIDLLHARRFPKETALLIPRWITRYIEDTWAGAPVGDAVEPIALAKVG